MRTGTVSYKLEDLRKGVIIPIGMVGENDFTRVIFDAEEVFKKHPDAQVAMKVQPPKGGIYPTTVTRDGNAVIWQVKAADVAHRGSGELQLTFTADTMVEKSYIAKTDIKRSLVGNGPAPDPVQDWLDEAQDALEGIESAEVHQPIIGEDGYWYTWNQETGEYEKTDTKAQGQDGHSPVLTSSKSGKTTTIFADGDQLAQILDGEDGQGADVIDDTAGEGDTDKTWSADKLDTEITDVKNAIQQMQPAATNADIGKALIVKTVADGKPTSYEYGAAGGADPSVIEEKVDAWLDENITNPNSPPLDRSLSSSSSAAPADVAGNIQSGVVQINNIIKNKSVIKSNETIYLQKNYDFTYSVASNTRVSTNPIYIASDEKVEVHASGFGKYAYSESDDGENISDYKSFTTATVLDITLTGPKYYRLLFGNAEDTQISVNDVVIKINNRLDKYDEFIKVEPITRLQNIDTSLPSGEQTGSLVSVTGSEVSIYDIQNINKVKVTRSISSVAFLLSNTLFDDTAEGLAKYSNQSGSSAEWENTEQYKYLYLTTKRTDTTYSAKLELPKITSIGCFPVILNNMVKSTNGYFVDVEKGSYEGIIVSTYGNMYVRNDNGVLQLSSDKGKTWNDGFDISEVGLVKSYHLFANGCIAFFTHQHAYYSEDWEEYHEADVYEADGVTTYVPSTYDNFFTSRDNQERKFIGTQDLYVFGNYGITDEENTRRIIWLSDDNGHSYKVIYEFNIQEALSIRHIHNVIYNKDYDRYLCSTGDEASESYVIEINIDGVNTPTFVTKGTGLDYKWSGIAFYGAYVYYCFDNTPGQLKKCKYQDISDTTKHEIVLDNLPNDAIGLFVGERGDMLITLSKYRTGSTNSPFVYYIDSWRMFYSTDRVNFVNFLGEKPTKYTGIYYGFNGVNAEGVIISGYWEERTELSQWGKLPSVSLDEMVKKNGYPNAFKPYDRTWEIVPVVDVLCEDVTVTSGGSVTIQPKLFPVDASSLAFSIIDYDSSVVSVNGATITGVAQGTTTAKVRSNLCYDAYAEITITVT